MAKHMLFGVVIAWLLGNLPSATAQFNGGQADDRTSSQGTTTEQGITSSGTEEAGSKINSHSEATLLLSAESRDQARQLSRQYGVNYEEYASFMKAINGVNKSDNEENPNHARQLRNDELEEIRKSQLQVTEFIITSPAIQVKKFIQTVHLIEKASIEAASSSFDPSKYNLTQRNNIRLALGMFGSMPIFRGLPYESKADTVFDKLFSKR